jgi:hypothetical protein
MSPRNTGRPWPRRVLALGLTLAGLAPASPLIAESRKERSCTPIGGMLMTNLGVISGATTLGVATGDLKGAVSATVLEVTPRADGAIVFEVQHHWVLDTGDTIRFDPVEVLAVPIAPGIFGAFALQNLKILGGTGRFEGAEGEFTSNIGGVQLFPDGGGETVFRYRGEVCFAGSKKQQ